MINVMEANVYCGTYRKYNNGSLNGKWLKLSDFTTKKNFLAACKELHKDEEHPEFMFQDWENLPTSLISESYVDDEVWHVINSIKKFAPERANEFAEWAADNGYEPDYAAFRDFMEWDKKEKKEKEDKSNSLQMSKEKIIKCLSKHPKYKRCTPNVSNVAVIGEHILVFPKREIETQFPFDDEDEAAMKMYHNFGADNKAARSYFKNRNMESFENCEILQAFKDGNVPELYFVNYCGEEIVALPKELDNIRRYYKDVTSVQATREEAIRYYEYLKFEMKKFETRLDNYLKRYGVQKCRTWSYWANA